MAHSKLRAALAVFESNIRENQRHGITQPLPFHPGRKQSGNGPSGANCCEGTNPTGRVKFDASCRLSPRRTQQSKVTLTDENISSPEVSSFEKVGDLTMQLEPERTPEQTVVFESPVKRWKAKFELSQSNHSVTSLSIASAPEMRPLTSQKGRHVSKQEFASRSDHNSLGPSRGYQSGRTRKAMKQWPPVKESMIPVRESIIEDASSEDPLTQHSNICEETFSSLSVKHESGKNETSESTLMESTARNPETSLVPGQHLSPVKTLKARFEIPRSAGTAGFQTTVSSSETPKTFRNWTSLAKAPNFIKENAAESNKLDIESEIKHPLERPSLNEQSRTVKSTATLETRGCTTPIHGVGAETESISNTSLTKVSGVYMQAEASPNGTTSPHRVRNAKHIASILRSPCSVKSKPDVSHNVKSKARKGEKEAPSDVMLTSKKSTKNPSPSATTKRAKTKKSEKPISSVVASQTIRPKKKKSNTTPPVTKLIRKASRVPSKKGVVQPAETKSAPKECQENLARTESDLQLSFCQSQTNFRFNHQPRSSSFSNLSQDDDDDDDSTILVDFEFDDEYSLADASEAGSTVRFLRGKFGRSSSTDLDFVVEMQAKTEFSQDKFQDYLEDSSDCSGSGSEDDLSTEVHERSRPSIT